MPFKSDFINDLSRPMGIGNNLFILGTSEDGPYMDAMEITSVEAATAIYGDREKGTLVKAFEQALEIKNMADKEISIYMMRITGKSATLNIGGFLPFEFAEHIDYEFWQENALQFRSIKAGDKYNYAYILLRDTGEEDKYEMIIRVPDSGDFVYPLYEYETIGGLVDAINADMRMGYHSFIVSTELRFAPTSSLLTTFDFNPEYDTDESEPQHFNGGEDGLENTKNDIYLALEQAYNILLGRPVDVIVVPNTYIDDVYPYTMYTDAEIKGSGYYSVSTYAADRDYLDLIDTFKGGVAVSFHKQMIDFCSEQMLLGYMSHGVMGFNPLRSIPEDIETNGEHLLDLASISIIKDRYALSRFEDGEWIDQGYFLTAVNSEFVVFPNTSNEFITTGDVAYAAILAGHFDTTTNVKLPDTFKLRYEISDFVCGELSKYGIVTYRESPRLGLVVHSGVTAALLKNELHNVANLRMVQLTIANINTAVEQIYEEDLAYTDAPRRKAIEEKVKLVLDNLTEADILTWYDYHVLTTDNVPMGGIYIKLRTKYTVEAISTNASIASKG